jgi:hypothetical protein
MAHQRDAVVHMVQEHPTWVLEESEQGWDDFHPAKGWPAASIIHRVIREATYSDT